MRFLHKSEIDKTILVISDLHLGAGPFVNERANFLEEFRYDKELVEFFHYYSQAEYLDKEVEVVINGDFLDFLAVPFVEFFDDEFWSEEASLARLDLILYAHREVMEALGAFLKEENKTVVYIVGNHDAEFLFESARKRFLDMLPKESRQKLTFITDNRTEYKPAKGIVVKHGHEYELSHDYDPVESIAVDDEGRKFFVPPWGSYYVTRIVNKFKEERSHVNAVRPVKQFLINGLIYDTMFTLRFVFHSFYYFIMVRFLFIMREGNNLRKTLEFALKELELFRDYEDVTFSLLNERDDVRALIVGHTHEPAFKTRPDGKIFINTGTWTDMYYLDFPRGNQGNHLTYAQIDVPEEEEKLDIVLNVWIGANRQPFREF